MPEAAPSGTPPTAALDPKPTRALALTEQSNNLPIIGELSPSESASGLGGTAMVSLRGRRLAAPFAALASCAVVLAASSPAPASAAGSSRAQLTALGRGASGAGRRARPPPVRAATCWPIQAQRRARSPRAAGTRHDPRLAGGQRPADRRRGTGTRHFPRATGQWPAVHGGQLFAGGAGGTARLRQMVALRSWPARPVAGGMRYRLSAWLGGDGQQCRRGDRDLPVRGWPGTRPAAPSARSAGVRPSADCTAGPPPARCRPQRPAPVILVPRDLADEHRRPVRAVRGLRPGGGR